MNAEELLLHYERVADSPDAIDHLRKFVLDLAIRGRLIAQNSGDDHAADLLRQIEAFKDRLSRGAEKARVAKIRPLADDVVPFPPPMGWVWARFGDLVHSRDSERVPVSKEDRSTRAKRFDYYGASGVIDKIDSYLFEKPLLLIGEDGANLVNRSTPIAFIARGQYWVNNHAHVLDGISENFLRYLELYINAIDLVPYITGTAQPKMNQAKMNSIPVALPPLAEQHRIVAKVDELMALCNRLEVARAVREAARDRLAAASLARLNSPDPESFADEARFALDALPALTTRVDQIKQLRQTILNLAVRGKIVHPKRGAAEAVAKESPDASALVDLPIGWQYERLDSLLAEDTRNGYSRRPDDAVDGTPILRISAGTVRRDGIVAEEEHKLISGIDPVAREQYSVRPGDLLACRFNGNKAFVGRLTIFTDYLGIGPIYPDKLIRIRVAVKLVSPEYLRLSGDSDLVRSQIEAFCATTVGNWGISATNLKEVRFPIPPLAEQRRIVAKVNELMSLCDRLAASLQVTSEHRSRLLEALLHNALESSDGVDESVPSEEPTAEEPTAEEPTAA